MSLDTQPLSHIKEQIFTHRQLLLSTARASIQHGFINASPPPINLYEMPVALQNKGSSFVTLLLEKNLRGCIGSLSYKFPLINDISYNAFQSAFHDSRFSPLAEQEFKKIKIEISILTPLQPVKFASEQELKEKLQVGLDGLVLSTDEYDATFIPAVWEDLPKVDDFLAHLKMKMGLPADFWSNRFTAKKFQAVKIGE